MHGGPIDGDDGFVDILITPVVMDRRSARRACAVIVDDHEPPGDRLGYRWVSPSMVDSYRSPSSVAGFVRAVNRSHWKPPTCPQLWSQGDRMRTGRRWSGPPRSPSKRAAALLLTISAAADDRQWHDAELSAPRRSCWWTVPRSCTESDSCRPWRRARLRASRAAPCRTRVPLRCDRSSVPPHL